MLYKFLCGNAIDILDTLLCINEKKNRTEYECVGFLDDDPSLRYKTLHGVPILGPMELVQQLHDCSFVLGFGSPQSYRLRKRKTKLLGLNETRYETIIHPSATVSRFARIGHGSVLLQNVTVASNANVGSHVLILPHSIISHDSKIGDYTCIASGVCISGLVTVEEECYLGTNSSVISNVTIGRGALVGMGTVVLKSVSPEKVFVGNPAKELNEHSHDS